MMLLDRKTHWHAYVQRGGDADLGEWMHGLVHHARDLCRWPTSNNSLYNFGLTHPFLASRTTPHKEFKDTIGFVPQDDTMHRELTVKEIIGFCAQLRLPADMPEARKHELVNNTIGVLGLSDVRHSKIGDEDTRGISGGQRKRVNIGMGKRIHLPVST
jgi:ABC-type cobalamin/Fe3+-siderophores transport system ATPase subunit